MAPSRTWWGKGSGGALHLTPGKVALQLAPGIENVKRNGWNRPKGKRSAQRAKRAQATGIAAEIERSEIAAQSPAAKRGAQKHRRAIHATGLWVAYRGRCRRERLERLGLPWVREPQKRLLRFPHLAGPAAALLRRSESIRCHVRARCQRNGSSPAAAHGGAGSGSRSTSLPRMRTCQDAGRIRRTAATATSRMGGAGGRVKIH